MQGNKKQRMQGRRWHRRTRRGRRIWGHIAEQFQIVRVLNGRVHGVRGGGVGVTVHVPGVVISQNQPTLSMSIVFVPTQTLSE